VDSNERYMNQDEVCELLRISRSSLYRYRRDRNFPVAGIKPLRFIKSDIIVWMKLNAQNVEVNGKK